MFALSKTILSYRDHKINKETTRVSNETKTACGTTLRYTGKCFAQDSINTVTDDDSCNLFSLPQYRQLAELRFQIRRYLQFSEHVARTHGIEPQQHQLMLTIKGLPLNTVPTVSALANRLCLRHHSTVELINRLVERGAAVRKPSTQDRRQVLVELTAKGEELLAHLNAHHNEELKTFAPDLMVQLSKIINSVAQELGDPDTPAPLKSPDQSDRYESSGLSEFESSDTGKLETADKTY